MGTKARQEQLQVNNMVMISDLPAEVRDRAVPGHWERNLIKGKNNQSPSVPWSSGHPLRVGLTHGGRQGSLVVERGHAKGHCHPPGQLVKTITWDQGQEMAYHLEFTFETDVPVYYCDPYSPWQ